MRRKRSLIAPDCRRSGSRRRSSVAVAGGLALDPLRVVLARPVLVHVAERHAAQGVAGGGVEHGEVEVAGHQEHQDQRGPVVHDHGAREAVRRVALAVPEQDAGRVHGQHQAADQGGVELLAGVEASLRRARPAVPETRGERRAASGRRRRRSGRSRARCAAARCGRRTGRAARARLQRDGAPEMPGLRGRPVEDALERRDAQAQAGEQHHEERRGQQPVRGALRAREPENPPGATGHSRSTCRPTRRCRSRAAPSSRASGCVEAQLAHPFHALVAVHAREHEAQRRAVRARQWLAVHVAREHHVRLAELRQRDLVDVRRLHRLQGDELRRGLWGARGR